MKIPSALKPPHIINDEITSELISNRMSGPFSVTQAHTIFGGHFCMSPLSLVEKDPGLGKWCNFFHLSKEDSKGGESMNGWLIIDDFPTNTIW